MNNKLNYCKHRFNQHIDNKSILGLLIIIEYYLLFIEYSRIITYFQYSFNNEFIGKFFLSKISIFRLINNIYNKNNTYPIYFIIINSILQFFFNIFYKIELDNCDLLYKIIINFYELIYFRTFSIIFFDTSINYIIFYIRDFNGIFETLIFLLTFITFILMIHSSFLIFSNYTIFKIKEKSYYPYDIITNFFNNYSMLLKVDLIIIKNLVLFKVSISKINICTFISILLVILMFFLYCVFYFQYPALYFQNFTFHKFRFCFILLCLFWTLIALCKIHKYIKIYYFCIFNFIVSLLLFMIFFSSKIYYQITTKDMMNFINNLFYIITIRNQSDDLYKKLFIEKLNFHYLTCNECNFCKTYLKIKEKLIPKFARVKTTTKHIKYYNKIKYTISTYDNDLFIFFSTYLEMFGKSLFQMNNKNNLIEIFYDLFTIYQYCFESRKVSYKLKCDVCDLIYKYKDTNQNIILNLIYIYQELFDSKDENSINIINNIQVYILFVKKITHILDRISNYFHNEIKSPINFLKLGIELKELRNKKNIEFLKSFLKTNDYCIDIISYILEEITNIPINKDKGFVKENLLLNEEILNLYYLRTNNIVISCNSKLNSYIIEKTGRDIIKFIGKDITSLFPKEFRNDGIKKLKKSLRSKHTLKIFDFLINYSEKKNDIIDDDNELNENTFDGKYKRFYMSYKLYFDNLENDDFYINGEYYFAFDDLVITKIFNNSINDFQEYIFAVYFNNKKVIKTYQNLSKINSHSWINYTKNLKKGKRDSLKKMNEFFIKKNGLTMLYENIKFEKIFTINKRNCEFIIYSSQKIPKKGTKNNLSIINVNSEFDEDNSKINIKLPDTVSLANSFNSQSSISSRNDNGRQLLNIKVEKKYKQYQSRFVSITQITFIFSLISITFCIISLFVELNQNNNLLYSYNVYTELRSLNRLFYNLVTSILAVNCIANPGEKNCTNYYKLYSEKNNIKNNINYPSFNYSLFENPYKVNDYGIGLEKLKKKIFELNDKEVNSIFNEKFIYTYISLKGKNISIENTTSTFVNALEMFFNGLLVIIKSNKYYNNPVYIFSMSNFDFINIFEQEKIEEWQKEYYNLIINYQKYLETWVNIQLSVGNNTNNRLKNLSKIVIVFLCVFCVFHIFLFLLLFYFIFSFENLYIMSVNKLMNKFKDEKFQKFFIQKYQILKILIKFFEENPVSIIHEIQNIYSEYNRTTNIKDPQKRNYEERNQNDKKNDLEKQYFPISEYRIITGKFYILIIIILIYHLLIFIIFLTIWYINKNKILNVFEIITDNTVAACSGYNMFALCQIMLLSNQTQNDISINMHFKQNNYLIYESTRSLFTIINLEKKRKSVKNLIKTTYDFIDLNCNSFYNNINDVRFEQIDSDYPEQGFRKKYPSFCKTFHILEYKNDLLFYKPIFYEINKFVFSLNQRNYVDYVNYLINGNLFYMCDLQFLIYRPFRSWFNNIVYNDAIKRSINLEKTILFCNLGITISSEFIIFIFLYYQLFGKLKKINSIIIGVKNTFKIIK